MVSIRDIEQRIERAARLPEPARPSMTQPTGIPAVYQDHIRLLADLLVLAFQADITRVSTLVFANEGSNRPYPFIEVRECDGTRTRSPSTLLGAWGQRNPAH